MSERIRNHDAGVPAVAGHGEPARSPARAVARLALDLVAVALIGVYLAAFAPRNVTLQWDARTYLDAARAALGGLNPYRLADLVAVDMGRAVTLPFLYPPIALVPFLPLATLVTSSALATWLGLKLLLLAGLVLLWKRLAPAVEWLPLALVTVFGFNGAALWDLRAGNVAIVEASLVWAGLACYLAGRRGAFAALITLAACFKLVPALLLLLLLVPTQGRGDAAGGGGRERPELLVAALLALGALVVGPLVIGPAAGWRGFLGNVSDAIPIGESNPSLLAMFLTLARGALGAGTLADRVAIAAWLAADALILVASRSWLAAAWRARDARRWAFAAAWLLVLLAPRPMAYGFVLLVPAPLALAPRPFAGPAGRLMLALVLSAQGLSRAANVPAEGAILAAAPALLAVAVWLLVVRASAPRVGIAESTPAV